MSFRSEHSGNHAAPADGAHGGGWTLVQVVPQMPPNVSGVGDYASALGEALRSQSCGAVRSAYVAAGGAAGGAPVAAPFATDLTGWRSAAALERAVGQLGMGSERTAVLLHYVGYGYAQRGAPVWLLRAVGRIRRRWPAMPLLTLFHELYATGRPHQSAFWLSPLQRYVAGRLARESGGVMATRHEAVRWLERRHRGRGGSVRYSPVFSTVGEVGAPPAASERGSNAVLFASGGGQRAVLDRQPEDLSHVLRSLGADHLVVIGGGARPAERRAGLHVEYRGYLPAGAVSAELSSARIGLISYPLAFVTKSSVMAAYMAHGTPTVVLDGGRDCRELLSGVHFLDFDMLRAGGQRVSDNELAAIGNAAFRAYQDSAHSTRAARELIGLLTEAARRQLGVGRFGAPRERSAECWSELPDGTCASEVAR